MPRIRITTYQSGDRIKEVFVDRAVVVGRRDPRKHDPPPVALHQSETESRLVVAESTQQKISRQWMRITPVAGDAFEIKNLHLQYPIFIVGDQEIPPGNTKRIEGESLIDLGAGLALRIETASPVDVDSTAYRTLNSMPLVPGQPSFVSRAASIGQFEQSEGQEINKMLQLALQVVQEAVGSDAFFQASASAATDMVDLDRTAVLLRHDAVESQHVGVKTELEDGWFTVAEYSRRGNAGAATPAPISTTLLQRVSETCLTIIHQPKSMLTGNDQDADQDHISPSLQVLQCAVASPILNAEHHVIGAIYGDRTLGLGNAQAKGINDLEATLIEILAGAVAGGLTRRNQERLRDTLAGFFSPTVAERLTTDPRLMDGRETEVSALFCDIRGFSSVTEKLGPRKAIAWINDVMSELSQCVIDLDGVLVNYMGDELFAMWGAPGEQTDHAFRAVETARSMLRTIDQLRTRWNDVLPKRFGAGVGINTGPALVGNVGSRQKFQYGPLGHTVNLSSRLQSATKQLGVTCLAGENTVQAAGCVEQSRRLAELSVVGIGQSINVYEIPIDVDQAWQKLRKQYEQALKDFENGRFAKSLRRLKAILRAYPNDHPSHRLHARAVQEIETPSDPFSSILNLTSK